MRILHRWIPDNREFAVIRTNLLSNSLVYTIYFVLKPTYFISLGNHHQGHDLIHNNTTALIYNIVL
jgi:hypothetical protein